MNTMNTMNATNDNKSENVLLKNKHILICIGENDKIQNRNKLYASEYEYIKQNFCGIVLSEEDSIDSYLSGTNDVFVKVNVSTLNTSDTSNVSNTLNTFKNVTRFGSGSKSKSGSGSGSGSESGSESESESESGSESESESGSDRDVIVYLCGDIDRITDKLVDLKNRFIYVIKELSYNYNDDSDIYNVIDLGRVPINIHNVGVYFREFFAPGTNYFNVIKNEHQFQKLTESNKSSNAFRKGIYLSHVDKNNSGLTFNLLRCSSNLSGATDNFRDTDNFIISELNDTSKHFFREKVKFNHVLAQIYENTKPSYMYSLFTSFVNMVWFFVFGKNFFSMKNTEKKAKIRAHSDKTKDMPRNAIMAFCTFYNSYNKESGKNIFVDDRLRDIRRTNEDLFDCCYRNTSALTKLHFRLKDTVTDKNLEKEFSITLYPNSVFMMSLSTNRLYTHEIKPSLLPVDKIPTRMGYVVRCSDTKALFVNNKTHILENNDAIPLRKITDDDMAQIRELYLKENVTDEIVEYKQIYCSMNTGDYKKPYL